MYPQRAAKTAMAEINKYNTCSINLKNNAYEPGRRRHVGYERIDRKESTQCGALERIGVGIDTASSKSGDGRERMGNDGSRVSDAGWEREEGESRSEANSRFRNLNRVELPERVEEENNKIWKPDATGRSIGPVRYRRNIKFLESREKNKGRHTEGGVGNPKNFLPDLKES